MALHLPSVGMGFYADDYTHQLVLRGDAGMPRPTAWSLYDFGATQDWTLPGGEVDALPWWTSPDWKIRFFRPLTSATLVLDHALFGEWAPGYHLTNLAWYALLLLLAHALYRALGLGRGTALAGLAFFAATSGATLPAGWPSNRNSVLSAALTLAAVLVLARGGGGARLRLPAALLLALGSCLAKESGVVGLPLLALWLLLDGRRRGEPAAWRAPAVCLALALAFVGFLAIAGYGTRSLFYATPWSDPLRYAGNLLVLCTAGLLRLVFPLSLDLLAIAPALVLPACVAGAAAAVLLGWRLARRLRDRPEALFLLAWLALSLAVEGGSPPSDRLLLSASIGSAGLLAWFASIALARRPPARARGDGFDRGLARALVVTAGVLSAGFSLLQSAAVAGMARDSRDAVLGLEAVVRGGTPRELILLQAANAFVPFSAAGTWAAERHDPETRIRVLQMGRRALAWTREDDRTFLLRSLDEPFLTHLMEGVFLSSAASPVAGTTWRTPAFVAEAVEVDGAGLRAVRFRLHRSLDDPGVRFLVERDGQLAALPPPAPGETVTLPRAVPRTPLTL